MLTNGSVWQTSATVDEPIKGLEDTTRLKISRRSGKGLETRSKRLAAYRRATFSDPPTACGVHAAPCGRLGQPVSLVVLRNKLFFSWLPVEKFARGVDGPGETDIIPAYPAYTAYCTYARHRLKVGIVR
jgi:hypothetical protein